QRRCRHGFLGRASHAKNRKPKILPAAGRQIPLNLLLFFPAHSFQPEVWQSQLHRLDDSKRVARGMDNFVGTKLNSRRLARRAKGRMPEVSPLAAYALLVLVNEVQLERGPEGFARGYLSLHSPRAKPAKSCHAVAAKPARQGWHP